MPKGSGRSGKRPKAKKPPPNRHTLASLSRQWAREKQFCKIVSKSLTVFQGEGGGEAEEPERPSSASENKLSDSDATVDPQRESWSGFRVVDIDKIFKNITECVACQKCRGNVKITEIRRVGLSSLYNLECLRKCGVLKTFRNSDIVKDNPTTKFETEANRRFVLASQALGIKHGGLKTLSAMMDLPPPISQKLYDQTVKFVHSAVQEEANASMLRAVEEEVELSGARDLKGSGDGTWQKRGFSSKNGVVSFIGAETGKVIDVEVMSTVCFGCCNYKGPKQGPEYDEWKQTHEADCSVNHKASSGMMEVEGMVKIFERSEARAGVRYESYIGDGDSKTFPAIVKAKPFGNDLIPKKIECTGHVQKRMGTRLRNLKKDMKSKKLSDGPRTNSPSTTYARLDLTPGVNTRKL
ncbi:Envelope protein UL45 [Frankliniella fusca]|uniref:Envelope protein UL45 n=1 Tax=Frankliniella fusca TaxID=407009 RepID=A0AAE1I493_9NEOP|nr:Envelope protein UL45 [Frankliniella fusca]